MHEHMLLFQTGQQNFYELTNVLLKKLFANIHPAKIDFKFTEYIDECIVLKIFIKNINNLVWLLRHSINESSMWESTIQDFWLY